MSKGLEGALGALDKRYGKGTAAKGKDLENKFADIPRISTSSIGLDIATGGGYPRGRIIEIYGPESSGKTTLTLHAIAEVQIEGGTAAFIDAEHTFDPTYAEAIGVDTDELIMSQPDNGEQAMEVAKALINSGEVDLIVVDSVAALTPKAEMEGEVGDSKMGLHARLMSQAMRMITGPLEKNNCTIIFINQLRSKIGVMFGSPETTTGGNALKFYASIRLDIRGGQKIKDGEGHVDSRKTKVKVVKNKVGRPYGEVELTMTFGRGFDKTGEVLDIAVELDIVKKAGSWYSYDDTKLGQGRLAAIELLYDNTELQIELEDKIKAVFNVDTN